jgi:hypothetical protein
MSPEAAVCERGKVAWTGGGQQVEESSGPVFQPKQSTVPRRECRLLSFDLLDPPVVASVIDINIKGTTTNLRRLSSFVAFYIPVKPVLSYMGISDEACKYYKRNHIN